MDKKINNSRVYSIIKNMLLIEDKLFNYNKRCNRCIKELLITIEGIGDLILQSHHKEDLELYPIIKMIPNKMRKLQKMISSLKSEKDINNVSQSIRKIRKDLTKSYYYKDKINEDMIKKSINHKCAKNHLEVLDPQFNIKESLKNVLLLKNHILIPGNMCLQCCRKHSMLIEAFLEESFSLDKQNKYQKLVLNNIKIIRKIQEIIRKLGKKGCSDINNLLNKMEKSLFDIGFDFINKC
jgi:hypothetical protein